MRNQCGILPLYLLLSLYCLQVIQNVKLRPFYRLYEWFWVIIFSCAQIGYIVWQISIKSLPPMQIPGTFYDLMLLLCNLSISGVLLKNRSRLDDLMDAMKRLTKNSPRRRSRGFAAVVVAGAFVVIFLRALLVLSYFETSKSLETLVIFISIWQVQRLEIFFVGICWIAWELQRCHRHFNKKLQRIQGFDSLWPHLQLYNRLCRAVSDFNDLFGYPIAFAVFTILCLTLGMLSTMISSDAFINDCMSTSEVIRQLVYLAPYLVSLLVSCQFSVN